MLSENSDHVTVEQHGSSMREANLAEIGCRATETRLATHTHRQTDRQLSFIHACTYIHMNTVDWEILVTVLIWRLTGESLKLKFFKFVECLLRMPTHAVAKMVLHRYFQTIERPLLPTLSMCGPYSLVEADPNYARTDRRGGIRR